MKAENTLTVELDETIDFDGFKVSKIKFDLEHINRGWNQVTRNYNEMARSNYTAEDVKDFFAQFGYYCLEWEEGRNKFKKEFGGRTFYRYISFVTDLVTEVQKKIVIDIPFVFNDEGIVVTIY